MNRIVLFLCCTFLWLIIFSSNLSAFTYYIDEYIQDNGTATFHDTFSDGNEPPSGPYTGADYYVEGTFSSNRESGGLLELNSSDAVWDDDNIYLEFATANSDYFFSSGSGGHLSGAFQANDGLLRNTAIGLWMSNDVDLEAQEDGAFIGVVADRADGSIHAVWGDENNEYSDDITSALGARKKITVKLLLDASNHVTAMWDYGSDGSFELTKTNFTQLDFLYGNYTGGFGVDAEVSDFDHDGIIEDGDYSGIIGDNPCTGGDTMECDDNCLSVPNADQADANNNGVGDVCEPAIELPELKVQALIDGRSHLFIQGSNVWWHHYDWEAPGQWGTPMPTILNGVNWYPEWPGGDENTDCDCDSSLYNSLYPPLPADGSPIDLVWISGRGNVSIIQQPAESNSYTAIIEFDDYMAHAEFYEIAVLYESESDNHPIDTDRDWQIGDFELLDAIDYWANGILGDFELLDLIDFWAAGSYCMDTGTGNYISGLSGECGDIPGIITEEWESASDDGLGSGYWIFTKEADGTITVVGEWFYNYYGDEVVCPFTAGNALISGSSFSFIGLGTATNPGAPEGYKTSQFTLNISGTVTQGEGAGTSFIEYSTFGWPDMTGIWTAMRTAGSGITD